MTKPGRIFLVAVAVAAVSMVPAGESPLQGRWLLSEQTYGAGSSNRAAVLQPIRLEFVYEGSRLAGRVWFDDAPRGQALAWPSLGQIPTDVEEFVLSPAEDRIRVRYRTRLDASPPRTSEANEHEHDNGTVLEVTEEYQVTSDGGELHGTVTVALFRGEKSGGSYVLKRRFQRER